MDSIYSIVAAHKWEGRGSSLLLELDIIFVFLSPKLGKLDESLLPFCSATLTSHW